jgi:hypothetical protein
MNSVPPNDRFGIELKVDLWLDNYDVRAMESSPISV